MNLGQGMMVIVALALLGFLALSANSSVMESNEISDTSEFGVTSVSLATSIIQEAMSKDFDQTVTVNGNVTDSSTFTAAGALGRESGESFRAGGSSFNDFDDFNNLFLVFTSPLDPTPEAGADSTIIIPGIRARYIVRAKVEYVTGDNLDVPVATPNWHKRLIVMVTRPATKDTIRVPSVMSYWN